jgi:hypothetical protein
MTALPQKGSAAKEQKRKCQNIKNYVYVENSFVLLCLFDSISARVSHWGRIFDPYFREKLKTAAEPAPIELW